MSETFFIKHTAFDDFSTDLTDREDASFVIGPGELNGPGGRSPRASDLELYGFGSLKWGEGVNQNLFRILQTFSCPQKESGDFLAGTDDPYAGTQGTPEEDPYAFVPGSGSFDPLTDPVTPKDEYDLGIGNGITVAVIGQLWFNSNDEEVYMYGTSAWRLVTASASSGGSAALTAHIADDNLHLTANQNTFLDGLNLPSLTSAEVNTLEGISLTLGSGSVQGQLDLMVEKAGDSMSGDLSMIGGNVILSSGRQLLFESGDHRITNNDGGGNFNIRVGNYFDTVASDTLYSDTGAGAAHIVVSHESTSPLLQIKIGEDSALAVVGQPVTFTGTTTFKNDGNVSVNAALPAAVDDLTRKDYVDNVASSTGLGSVPIGGIIMYNGSFAAIPANWKLCDGANGTPNLTNKFIYGTNAEGNVGNTGGSANATLVAHTHTRGNMNITGSLTGIVRDQNGSSTASGAISKTNTTINSDGGESRAGMNMNFNAASAWSGSTSSAGSSATNKNLPPYYTLAFIRRMS